MTDKQVIIEETLSDSTKLVSLDRVLRELDVEIDSSDSDLEQYYEDLIEDVSAEIADYCNRRFEKVQVRELKYGQDRHEFLLSYYPIDEVESVKYVGNLGGFDVVEDDYMITEDKAGLIVRGVPWYDTRFYHQYASSFPKEKGYYFWEIVYTAGYDLPDEAPRSLQRAALEFVKFKDQTSMHPAGIVEDQMGKSSRRFSSEGVDNTQMPSGVQRMLNKYRSFVLA